MNPLIAPEPLTPCASCGRELPADDLVVTEGFRVLCGPCQEEAAKAEDRRDSIDAAWASVERLLPSGWSIAGVYSDTDVDGMWRADAEGPGPDWAVTIGDPSPTPAGALRGLARKLADRVNEP